MILLVSRELRWAGKIPDRLSFGHQVVLGEVAAHSFPGPYVTAGPLLKFTAAQREYENSTAGS